MECLDQIGRDKIQIIDWNQSELLTLTSEPSIWPSKTVLRR